MRIGLRHVRDELVGERVHAGGAALQLCPRRGLVNAHAGEVIERGRDDIFDPRVNERLGKVTLDKASLDDIVQHVAPGDGGGSIWSDAW